MKARLLQWANIRPGEWKPILAMMTLSFLMGMALAFYFTASISVFMDYEGSTMLPYAYLISGAVGFAMWMIDSFVSRHMRFTTRVFLGMSFLLCMVAALTYLKLDDGRRWVPMALLVGVTPVMFICNIMFWGMAQKLFNISQAKRLFGMIGSGEVVSSILGFMAIPALAPAIGSTGLLVIAFGALLLGLVLMAGVFRMLAGAFKPEENEPSDVSVQALKVPGEQARYFRRVLAFSILPIFVFYFVDYLFLDLTSIQFHGETDLATFMGYFLGAVSTVELLLKAAVFSKVAKHYGIRVVLLVIPSVLILATLLTIATEAITSQIYLLFCVIAFTKLLERSLNSGLQGPGMQIIYQAVPATDRSAFQSKVDGISGAFGNILAGTGILLFLKAETSGFQLHTLVLLSVLCCWAFLVSPLYKAYRKRLALTLQAPDHGESRNEALSGRELLQRWISSGNNTQRTKARKWIHLMQKTNRVTGKTPASIQMFFEELPLSTGRAGLRESTQTMIGQMPHFSSSQLSTLLASSLPTDNLMTGIRSMGDEGIRILEFHRSQSTDLHTKRRIIGIYAGLDTPPAREALVHALRDSDRETMLLAGKALFTREFDADKEHRPAIRQKISETAYTCTWLMASMDDLKDARRNKALMSSLQTELEEQVDMLFMLCGFLYGQATINLIRNNLHPENNLESKVYALEVVDNLFDADIKEITYPLFEDLITPGFSHHARQVFPQQQLSVVNRAIHILYGNQAHVTRWTQVNALLMLDKLVLPDDARREIIGCIFHRHPLIYETAFALLMKRDPDEVLPVLNRLPADKLERLKGMYTGDPGFITTYERVLLLQQFPFLNPMPPHRLVDIAENLVGKPTTPHKKIATNSTCIILPKGAWTLESVEGEHVVTSGPAFLLDDILSWWPESDSVSTIWRSVSSAEHERYLSMGRQQFMTYLAEDPLVTGALLNQMAAQHYPSSSISPY
ncbi:MAG: MFS transporter [Flavobacteriales bacterium]|nr:MFS transporter [Flavobacteriales bacterium]MCB9448321.1 MFS transporter [Flavobacteriales bacterium]